jgi:integrase
MALTIIEKPTGSGKHYLRYFGEFVRSACGKDTKFIGTLEEAEVAKAEGVIRIFNHRHPWIDNNVNPTFVTLNAWWERYKEERFEELAPNSREKYEEDMGRVLKIIGHETFDRINEGTIERLAGKLRKQGYSKATIGMSLRVLNTFFKHAKRNRIIKSNPAEGHSFYYRKAPVRSKGAYLTPAEVSKFLSKVIEMKPRFFALFSVMIELGLRVGETIALEWADIDFETSQMTVRQSLSHNRLGEPKRGPRTISMTSHIIEVLKAHREYLDLSGLLDVLVFPNTAGGYQDHNNLRSRVFIEVLDAVGLKRIRLHDLRHTCASLRVAAGESIEDVAELLGHSSIQLTWDTYKHLIPKETKREISIIPIAVPVHA